MLPMDVQIPYLETLIYIRLISLYYPQVAMKSSTECVQIHGGYGYIREYNVERFFRDAKILEIGEGTSEVQRIIISREILKSLSY